MTTELQEYKCPLCFQQLGAIQYREVCEKTEKLFEQRLEPLKIRLKIQHDKEMQRLQEKHDLEMKNEVDARVNQEKAWVELRHNHELVEKDKIIEQVRQQKDKQLNQIKANHLQSEKENELKLKRLEAQLEKQQKIIDSKASELKGTAAEFVLLDLLQKEFPRDHFTTKKNGKRMADVIQTVVTEKGDGIPTPIVYDVKMGENVTRTDIDKAKNYMLIHKTPHSIIVTKDIKNERYSEEREGILLVHPLAVPDIAQQLRKSLIETGILIRNNTNRNTKESKMYCYFTSREYTMNMTERIELKLKYDNFHKKEEALRNQKNICVEKLVELEHKNDTIIIDIAQDDVGNQNTADSNVSNEILM